MRSASPHVEIGGVDRSCVGIELERLRCLSGRPLRLKQQCQVLQCDEPAFGDQKAKWIALVLERGSIESRRPALSRKDVDKHRNHEKAGKVTQPRVPNRRIKAARRSWLREEETGFAGSFPAVASFRKASSKTLWRSSAKIGDPCVQNTVSN